MDFPAYQTVRNKCLLCKPPSLWYFCHSSWTSLSHAWSHGWATEPDKEDAPTRQCCISSTTENTASRPKSKPWRAVLSFQNGFSEGPFVNLFHRSELFNSHRVDWSGREANCKSSNDNLGRNCWPSLENPEVRCPYDTAQPPLPLPHRSVKSILLLINVMNADASAGSRCTGCF